MKTQTRRLRPPGSLSEHEADVLECTTEVELRELFRALSAQGRRATLIGSARSFGEHFIPPSGALGVDISRLERGAQVVEELGDGAAWVRVGGGTRFIDLKEQFPLHRVLCVPTSDQITVAGALAACAHSSGGYFPDSVRGFRLLTPEGETVDCHAEAEGLARELFWAVPGSFGALGVTTQIELILRPIAAAQLIGVHSLYAGASTSAVFFERIFEAKDSPRFSEGLGAVIYGNRGHGIVLADELLPLDHRPDSKQALLTDEDLEEHAFTQGLANRFPRIAENKVRATYPEGIMRWAPWYGFQYYQRGYDKAYEVLGRKTLKNKLARVAGVDRRVPVAHQAWFFPRSRLRDFVEMYFSVLDQYPGIEKQGEQQDIVLLSPSKWPAHSLGRTVEDVGVFTASYSVTAQSEKQRARIIEFFQAVTARTQRDIPEARVSLCKQVHCSREILLKMHAPWVSLIFELKNRVDPRGILTSNHLEMLLS